MRGRRIGQRQKEGKEGNTVGGKFRHGMRQGNWRNEAAKFEKRQEEYKETIQIIRYSHLCNRISTVMKLKVTSCLLNRFKTNDD